MKEWSIRVLMLAFVALTFQGCQKELSLESGLGLSGGTAEATLGGAPGDCANIEVRGVYAEMMAVTDSNIALIDLTFTKAGSYTVVSDTCNGLYFKASGITTATGLLRLTLKAYGTPTNPGICNFNVSFKGSNCSFALQVLMVAPASTGDYFPTTVGSNWTYQSNSPNARTGDTTLTVSTNSNAVFSTLAYRTFSTENSLFKDSAYYRKTGNDYLRYGDLDVAGISDSPVTGEYVFLKDNVAANTAWETPEFDATINGFPTKMKLRFLLTAKDVDVSLSGALIRKVIKVTTTCVTGATGGPFSTIVSYDSWYAKGIGLVNLEAPAPAYGYHLIKYQVF